MTATSRRATPWWCRRRRLTPRPPRRTTTVSVGDQVWIDTDRDGLQSAGEPGVEGVTVTLTDPATGDTRTTTTDADGYYWFDDLTPGADYTLKFAKPDGYAWTTQDASGASDNSPTGDVTDSDVSADGSVSFTAPETGQNAWLRSCRWVTRCGLIPIGMGCSPRVSRALRVSR
ncbi:MAG: hypothetical protein CSA84_02910 [Actinomycetales bacterium]|nr:MAG: hypothetical protein CSA84_02910 [Actinomycetales bacterium]